MKHLLLACVMALASCNVVTGSDMPDTENPAALRAAAVKLSPIAPGGPPNDTGLYGTGQPGSDRYLFIQRLKRWADEDSLRRMNIDYQPEPLPRSIKQAINEQRVFEAERKARVAARLQAEREREAAQRAQELTEAREHQAARDAKDLVERTAAAEAQARFQSEMENYEQCVRRRQSPDAPQARGAYPEKDCEQLRDEGLGRR